MIGFRLPVGGILRLDKEFTRRNLDRDDNVSSARDRNIFLCSEEFDGNSPKWGMSQAGI